MNKEYQWNSRESAPSELFERFPELSETVVQLLSNRGITTQEEVDHFLTPDYSQDQHDPYLFADMEKAIARIASAIEQKESIVIHGDYDADGVCASSVLYLTLQKIGATVEVYLPHRDTEGYGLNMSTIQTLSDQKTNLIITVDCGISNKDEITKAKELGMDVIVTDHHSQPPEMPTDAYAILNPKLEDSTYPFPYLAGVGVSFKVCQALIRKYELGEAFEKWLLDLVAISTVTDFVELTGENRVFLKYGLVVLQKNRRPGLRQLFKVMGIDPATTTSETIGYKIGPHINAAGRVNHANMALELMIEEDETKAEKMAQDLAMTNKERQSLSEKMSRAAIKQAEEQKDEFVIIVESDDWPVGLVGLVAGKVASKYNRPTYVITSMGEEMVGSGRSIEQFNLVEAVQSMDELFTKYGGHPMACGFSLKGPEQFEEFKTRMRARAQEILADVDMRKTIDIESEIELPATNWDLVEVVEQCAPYGEGNPQPIFASRGVTVDGISVVGKTGTHLKLIVSQGGTQRQCIGFGFGEWADQLELGGKIDLAYTAGVNEWNGNREIQLMIKDIKSHEA